MMMTLAAGALREDQLTVLLLSLAVLLGLSRLLGETARQFKQPAVLGEILAGIVLGPTILGVLSPGFEPFLGVNLYEWLFPLSMDSPTRIAEEGFIMLCATLLLLVVGIEVDLSTVYRQGKAMVLVSICGIVLPFTGGFSLGWMWPDLMGIGSRATPVAFALFVGIAMSITALPVIAKILMDLNLAKSDMGVLVISSAMLNDVVGWIGFAVVLALLGNDVGVAASLLDHVPAAEESVPPSIGLTIGLTLGFLAFMLTVGRWLCDKAMPWVQARWAWPGGVLAFVFTIGLACAAFTSWLGIHSIFGAFVAGIALGDSRHLTERTRETIQQFVTNFFSPLFFASIGLRINFVEQFDFVLVMMVLGVAMIGKVIGSFFGARIARMGKRESWAVGFGMAAQGAVGIILGQLARQQGLITDELMVAVVIMAVTTSLVAGPAMQHILKQRVVLRLTDLLSDRLIVLDLQATDADQAIRELCVRAAEATNLDTRTLAAAVIDRERVMQTGLPGGLAVPHARIEALRKPMVIIGRSNDGIDFNAADGSLARFVCLLLSPASEPESQIELLRAVATSLGSDTMRRQLINVRTPTEFRAALNLAESQAGNNLHPAAAG